MSLASFWLTLKTKRGAALQLLLATLLFGAGYQAGRVTSPYYAAHPIIFEDRACSECASSGGTAEELIELKETGVAQRKPTTTTAAAPEAQPTVAAATTTAGDQTGQFVGSVNSDLFHLPDCPSVSRIKEENQIWFASVEEAQAAGYSPSKCTTERLGL